jgi:general secretion pathway protein K
MRLPATRCDTPLRQTGVALITVMLVVALATTAAVAMAGRQQLDIRRTANALQQGQAWMYLLGMEDWAAQFLGQDRRDNDIDHPGEDWATRLPPLPVEGGELIGALEDLQGRFNLNNLAQGGEAGNTARQRFERLLQSLQLSPGLAGVVQDWLDADQEARFPAGAEDVYYLGQAPSYRAANHRMSTPDELLLLKDIGHEEYRKLQPYITTLPVPTPLNVNTASAELLASLADDLVVSEVQGLLEKRQDTPYSSIEDFLAEPVFAGKKIPDTGLAVQSDYFLLQAEANIGHLRQRLYCLLERDDKGRVQTRLRSQSGF